jgi:hypothetical protein
VEIALRTPLTGPFTALTSSSIRSRTSSPVTPSRRS